MEDCLKLNNEKKAKQAEYCKKQSSCKACPAQNRCTFLPSDVLSMFKPGQDYKELDPVQVSLPID